MIGGSPRRRRGRSSIRRFRFLGAAAMAPVRCLLPLLPALALALGPAAGELRRPLALGEAEELAEELWDAEGLPGDLPELEPECRRLLAAFAEGSAMLTGCLGRRARPVRLCQDCHRHYRSLLAQYGSIARAVGVRPGGAGETGGRELGAARRPGATARHAPVAGCGGVGLGCFLEVSSHVRSVPERRE